MLESSTKKLINEQKIRNNVNHLMEVNDVESDIADLTDRLDNLSDVVEDDIGRMGFVRQLTAEFLEIFITMTKELENDNDVKIPETAELMTKVMGRKFRKRYYMSKFRL